MRWHNFRTFALYFYRQLIELKCLFWEKWEVRLICKWYCANKVSSRQSHPMQISPSEFPSSLDKNWQGFVFTVVSMKFLGEFTSDHSKMERGLCHPSNNKYETSLHQACFFTGFAAIQDNGISLILSLEKKLLEFRRKNPWV